MYNWSVDEKEFKKADPEGYQIWRLEQMINYGTAGEKISERLVRQNWPFLKDRIDPEYRKFLEFILWPKSKNRKLS
ncbi:MAG: hypothetical protein HY093_04955 [Candidatus Liptonbacteria bacterium]|nr:hypothetical protein [Candidatus Liptonbacteria bacterium]